MIRRAIFGKVHGVKEIWQISQFPAKHTCVASGANIVLARPVCLWVCFLKIGLCFYRKSDFVFIENRTLFLSKIGVCFLKIGVCFFWKSEFVVLKIGACFYRKSEFVFWKSEFVFENRGLIFGWPSPLPLIWRALFHFSLRNKRRGRFS